MKPRSREAQNRYIYLVGFSSFIMCRGFVSCKFSDGDNDGTEYRFHVCLDGDYVLFFSSSQKNTHNIYATRDLVCARILCVDVDVE